MSSQTAGAISNDRAGGFVLRRVRSARDHGIIADMKSFIAPASILVLVSLACSASKSAGSERVVNQNAEIQSASTTTSSNTNQEKQPCTLTQAGSPTLNGLRLGMTIDEVLAIFPGSKDDSEVRLDLSRPPSQFGVSELIIRPSKFESKEKFVGISQITFVLLDGRVSTVNIGYNGPAYSHVDQFVTKFVEGTNLPPPDQWQAYVGMDTQLKTLTCKDFEIRVFAGGEGGNLNYVLMKDLDADKKLKDRRAKARAQATPKP